MDQYSDVSEQPGYYDPNKHYSEMILDKICHHLLQRENDQLSISNIIKIRKLGQTCRYFNQYMRKKFSYYYDLILFFKGQMSASKINGQVLGPNYSKIPITDKFWVIPRPIGSGTDSVHMSQNHIRFSHFCLDREYDNLKQLLIKQYGPEGHPILTDVISPVLSVTDPCMATINTRLKRIRKGKTKKVRLFTDPLRVCS